MTITPDQAKTLLDAITPGPWEAYDPGDGTVRLYAGEREKSSQLLRDVDGSAWRCALVYFDKPDGELLAAAPDLARTVIDQAEEIDRKKQALSTYGGVIATLTRDLAKAIGHEDLLDEDGVHNQDIYEIAYEMIAEAREAREVDQ